MKLLHTSDWHLGASEGDYSLEEDQRFFIDAICRIVEEKHVDAVLLGGDVFDRSVASAWAVQLYDYAMTRLCRELHTTVLTIAGNHDSAERLSNCGGLLEQAGLHVAGSAGREPKVVSLGDAQIFLLPWITEERVKSLFPEEAKSITSLTDAYRVMTDSMRQRFCPGQRHILLAHAFAANSETSTSDRAAEIGFAAQIHADVFRDFDYTALGHIHKPQDINGFVRYSGTPMPYSFGKEEDQIKSVTIVDTATMEREVVPLPLLHPRTTITGTYEQLLAPTCGEEARSGYVRLTVTDTAVGLEMLSRFREIYPHLLVVSGKSYDGGETSITLTLEEFEQMEHDPAAVFRSFCREEIGEEATGHFMELFADAVRREETV